MKPPSATSRHRPLPRGFVPLLAACILHSSSFIIQAAAPPDPLIPQPVAADRYRALATRSPFSPPTMEAPPPVQAPTPPPPAWGDKYTLSAISQIGAGYRVTLNPKNPTGAGAAASSGGNSVNASERLIVTTGEPTADGITLAGVQWSDDPKQTRATLIRNGVPAVFTFDATAVTAARGNAATAASVPAPRSSASSPGIAPATGFNPAMPMPDGAQAPGIVRGPATRGPIRPPPPAPGANGMPLMAPPPGAPVRAAPLPAPGQTAVGDDD